MDNDITVHTVSYDMLCITAPSYTEPSNYELTRLPAPTVSDPTDVRIEVHAASINPVDVKKASGVFKRVLKEEYGFFLSPSLSNMLTERR